MAKNKKDKKALKKGQATFQLIGEAKVNDYTFKIDEQSQKSDWVYNVLNLGVDCGQGNIVYADMSGGYGSERDNIIYVHGVKEVDGKQMDDWSNRFTIDWDDRFDEAILETIGDNCFITVGLEKDKKDKVFPKKFLSGYDAIEYVKENLADGMVVNVKGDLKYSIYNETAQVKKEIKSIFLSKIDDPTKYKATFTQTILLDKDSVGKLDKEKAVYPIEARVIDYTKLYNDKLVKQNIPFNKTFELEVDKEKPENTKKFIDKVLKVKKGITELIVEGDIVEGQSLVTVTDADIPADIMELIEMGVYTREEAIGKMAVSGSKEKRMIIRKPVIKMVGDDDNKIPQIMKQENEYEEDDLILDFMFDDVDNEKDEEDIDDAVDTDEEEEDWLKALGEEE